MDNSEYICEKMKRERPFRMFGGGSGGNGMNPIAEALKNEPLQFAAGVDVRSVIEYILQEAEQCK